MSREQAEIASYDTNLEFDSLGRNEIPQAVSFVSSINKNNFPFLAEELMNLQQYEEETQKMIELSR